MKDLAEGGQLPVIKVAGVSAGGKSTLVAALRERGYDARPVSQEHSHVPDLWRQFGLPRVLIFLDNSLEGQRIRRPDVTWDAASLAEEHARLSDASEHADLRINTAALSKAQVLELVVAYLQRHRIAHAVEPLPVIGRTGAPGATEP